MWLDSVVSAADIAKAEQEAVDEVFPSCTHTERLFRTRSLATDYSQAVELFSITHPRLLTFFLLTLFLYPSEHHERNQLQSFMTAVIIVSMMKSIMNE